MACCKTLNLKPVLKYYLGKGLMLVKNQVVQLGQVFIELKIQKLTLLTEKFRLNKRYFLRFYIKANI